MRENREISKMAQNLNTSNFSVAEGFVVCCFANSLPTPESREASPNSYPDSFEKKVKVLEYYPLTTKELIKELNLNYICFTEGALTSGTQNYFLHHISITSQTGIKRYATCLNILSGKYSGIALCLLSRLPLYDLFEKWIIECYYCLVKHTRRKIKNARYSLEFMLSLLFFHLQFSPNLNNEVLITYQFDQFQSEGVLGTYKCTQEHGLTIPNTPLLKLFEIIKPLHIFEIMKLLLLEKKIVIIKKNASDLSSIIESFLVLLYPFEWTGVDVSYLSYEMAEYIEAPMPYIIGIERQVWKKLQKERGKEVDWVPPDVSVYDRDLFF